MMAMLAMMNQRYRHHSFSISYPLLFHFHFNIANSNRREFFSLRFSFAKNYKGDNICVI